MGKGQTRQVQARAKQQRNDDRKDPVQHDRREAGSRRANFQDFHGIGVVVACPNAIVMTTIRGRMHAIVKNEVFVAHAVRYPVESYCWILLVPTQSEKPIYYDVNYRFLR